MTQGDFGLSSLLIELTAQVTLPHYGGLNNVVATMIYHASNTATEVRRGCDSISSPSPLDNKYTQLLLAGEKKPRKELLSSSPSTWSRGGYTTMVLPAFANAKGFNHTSL